MLRNDLVEASEDEFLAAVRVVMRVQGRGCLIDAILNESAADNSQLSENMDDNSPSESDSDDSDEPYDEQYEPDDDESVNDSVDEEPQFNADKIMLHDPVVHDYIHCPPFVDLSRTFCGMQCGVCDCDDFNFAQCLQEGDYQFFKNCYYTIDFAAQYDLAKNSIMQPRRKLNNELRKYFYKKVFIALDFGVLEKGERKKLPNCAVARIRQIFPSDTGYYMGFKQH